MNEKILRHICLGLFALILILNTVATCLDIELMYYEREKAEVLESDKDVARVWVAENATQPLDFIDDYIEKLNIGEVIEAVKVYSTTLPLASEPQGIVVGSVSMKTRFGVVQTDEVFVDVEALHEIYTTDIEIPEWDMHAQMPIIKTLWNFLTVQQGIPEKNAAAILGAIACEGDFAEQQGTSRYISNIEQARTLLGAGKHGYGVAQWTYKTRQEALLAYYELASQLYPDDWDKVRLAAECAMLLEELKAYRVFDDIYSETTIEDALGRMCILYERYENVDSQWYLDGESYTCVGGSGAKSRMNYANHIYDYFTGGNR